MSAENAKGQTLITHRIDTSQLIDQHSLLRLHVHTHTRLAALFPGLPGLAGTRNVKPIWILLKQETVSGSGISWAICKSAPCSRQITTPAPHHSFFCRPDALPAAQPTASKHWRQCTNWSIYNLMTFAVSVFQATSEHTHAQSQMLRQIRVPVVQYKTPADDGMSVGQNCGQWHDERTAVSSTLTTGGQSGASVDDGGGEADVLSDLLSGHVNDAGCSVILRDSAEVVNVRQTDDEPCDGMPTAAERSYICFICTKMFSRSSDLMRHVQIHTGERRHACDACGKRFTQRGDLRRHMLTHGGGGGHRCEICERRFSQRCDVTRHMRRHSGAKPHSCGLCDKRFVERGQLRRHVRTHGGLHKAHECDVCHRRFTERTQLHRHRFTHAEQTPPPHRCSVCTRAFATPCDLTRHLHTHSADKPHACAVCSRQFTQRGSLNRHMRRTHTTAPAAAAAAAGRWVSYNSVRLTAVSLCPVPKSAANTNVCRYNWHSAGSLGWPFPMLNTHTRLMPLFPGLPGWAGTRKVKPVWILLKRETVSGSGISWAGPYASLHLAPDR